MPIAPAFKKETEEFFGLYTLTMNKWMDVEDNLAQIFVALIRPAEPITAYAALSAVQFEAKLRIVHLVANEALAEAPELLKKWSALRLKIKRVVPKRNTLAHSRVDLFADDLGKTIRLTPTPTNISTIRQQQANHPRSNVYDVKRLEMMLCSFQITAKRMDDYLSELKTHFA